MAGLMASFAVKARSLYAGTPTFLSEEAYCTGSVMIDRVVEIDDMDIVVLSGGLRRGLRSGMVCAVVRREKRVGEIILVEVTPNMAAGLIMELDDSISIQSGDCAMVKTYKFN